jgi:sigma-E factor negative regulatory protein RseC
MESVGIIKSKKGIMARVIVEMSGGCCDHCEKETCDITETGIETEAINEARAVVGQKVKVVMKSYTYIKGAIVLYILPIFALISGAILGKIYLPAYIKGIDNELHAVIGGFFSFFISLIFVKILSGIMEKKTEYKSVIKSIIEV